MIPIPVGHMNSGETPMTDPLSRRDFLSVTAAGTVATSLAAAAPAGKTAPRKRMAIVTTVWRYLSHAQHMGDRFLVGYPMDGRWREPQLDVVSLYVDQTPKGDLSKVRAKEFGFKIYPSIAEALRRGGKRLDVDAVLVIGEHGDYPRNDIGQKKYPRYPFFKQIANVFQKDGKSVPVFNDKHLSWKWSWAKEMVETSRKLKFPLMAGSSLPVTWRMPAVDMPLDGEPKEIMGLGVKWVQGLRGEAVWKAMETGSWKAGGWSPQLFEACLTRSQTLAQPHAGFNHRHPTKTEIRKLVKDPVAYRFEYTDGLRGTMFLMNGLVGDFTFAATMKGKAEPLSTLFYLPPTPNVHYSAVLMSYAEKMFLTGQSQYPVERTLLTSGILESAMKSMAAKGAKLSTPHLAVQYHAPQESLFCRT